VQESAKPATPSDTRPAAAPISVTQQVPPQIGFAITIPDAPPSGPRPHVVMPPSRSLPAVPRPIAQTPQGPTAEDDFALGARRRRLMTIVFLVVCVVAGAGLGLLYRRLMGGG
jgi:hypothetical protein